MDWTPYALLTPEGLHLEEKWTGDEWVDQHEDWNKFYKEELGKWIGHECVVIDYHC
jgi:hypothetical protein